jgi:hypothetical protein
VGPDLEAQQQRRRWVQLRSVEAAAGAFQSSPPLPPNELVCQLQESLCVLQKLPGLLSQATVVIAAAGADQYGPAMASLVSDITEYTELLVEKQNELAEDKNGIELQLGFVSRKRKQKLRLAAIVETAAEIFNEVGDALFLFILWAEAKLLFLCSMFALLMNLVGRVWIIRQELRQVDKGEEAELLDILMNSGLVLEDKDEQSGRDQVGEDPPAPGGNTRRKLHANGVGNNAVKLTAKEQKAKARLEEGRKEGNLRRSKLAQFWKGAAVYMIEANTGSAHCNQQLFTQRC